MTILISNITIEVLKDSSVTISWDSTSAGTSVIEYGIDTSYGNSTSEDVLSYYHVQQITGLVAGTLYHYRIRTKEYDNTESISVDYTFTTRTQLELETLVKAARTDNALPKTYYITPTGNDSNNGLSEATSWNSMTKAGQIAEAGDIVLISGGSYINQPDQPTIINNGIPEYPIIFKSYNGLPQFINISGTGSIRFLMISDKSYINIIGPFYVEGNYNGGYGYSSGIYMTASSHHININGVQLIGVGNPIAVWRQSHHILIENNECVNWGWNGIAMYGVDSTDIPTFNRVHHVIVRNNILHDFSIHNAIDCWGDDQYITIYNNEIYNTTSQIPIYIHEGVNGKELNKYICVNNNYIHDTTGPMRIISTTDITVINNITENTTGYGIDIFFDLEDGAGAADQIMTNIFVLNNFITGRNYPLSTGQVAFEINTSDITRIPIGYVFVSGNNFLEWTELDGAYLRLKDGSDVTLRDTNLSILNTEWKVENTIPAPYIPILEYTEGRIFSAKTSLGIKYITTHYPNRLSRTLITNRTGILVTSRPMTAVPTTDTATISVNSFDTSLSIGSTLIDLNITSINTNNIYFSIDNLKAYTDYSVKLNGTEILVATTNINGSTYFNKSNWGATNKLTINEIGPANTVGTLNVTTTPINGDIFVDGLLIGSGNVTLNLLPKIYTISFGDVPGYGTPHQQQVNIIAGTQIDIIGTYLLCPNPIINISITQL